MRSIVILSFFLAWPLAACAKDENLLTIEIRGMGAPQLSISVPSGYVHIEKHKGPDFDVNYITSKNPGDPALGIYVGHHPNLFSSQKKGLETKKETDVILGQKVEWISWREEQNEKTIYHYETIAEGAFKGFENGYVAGLMVHVFIEGSDHKKVNLLKASSKSLRIVRK